MAKRMLDPLSNITVPDSEMFAAMVLESHWFKALSIEMVRLMERYYESGYTTGRIRGLKDAQRIINPRGAK